MPSTQSICIDGSSVTWMGRSRTVCCDRETISGVGPTHQSFWPSPFSAGVLRSFKQYDTISAGQSRPTRGASGNLFCLRLFVRKYHYFSASWTYSKSLHNSSPFSNGALVMSHIPVPAVLKLENEATHAGVGDAGVEALPSSMCAMDDRSNDKLWFER